MSEAQHISEILPAVMADIGERMERRAEREQARDHRARVLTAVGNFYQNGKGHTKSNNRPVKDRQRTALRKG